MQAGRKSQPDRRTRVRFFDLRAHIQAKASKQFERTFGVWRNKSSRFGRDPGSPDPRVRCEAERAGELSKRGRAVRLVATTAVLVALLAGTFWGDDDSFPFGPFRMYSVANKTSGRITATRLDGVIGDGPRKEIDFGRFGLRRAEVEGRVDWLLRDPDRLELLAEAFENMDPDGPELTKLYLVEEVHQLEGGRPVDSSEETLAVWTRT
jgi:hypothetical protein